MSGHRPIRVQLLHAIVAQPEPLAEDLAGEARVRGEVEAVDQNGQAKVKGEFIAALPRRVAGKGSS